MSVFNDWTAGSVVLPEQVAGCEGEVLSRAGEPELRSVTAEDADAIASLGPRDAAVFAALGTGWVGVAEMYHAGVAVPGRSLPLSLPAVRSGLEALCSKGLVVKRSDGGRLQAHRVYYRRCVLVVS